jgi:tetratricopeptide (TPR) repeat protein
MRSRVVALLVCAALAWGSPALAQPEGEGAPAAASAEAQEQFARGVAAFEEGRLREAVELFKAADALAPSARLSFNIGKVYERMGDSRAALAAYRDYLRRLPEAENRDQVSQRIDELEGTLEELGIQQLSVFSTPSGATVVIDGTSRGVTPWTGELAPGVHRVDLQLPGYQNATRSMELPAQHATDLVLQLEPGATPTGTAPADAADATSPGAAVLDAPDAPPLMGEASVAPMPRWWTWALFGGSAALLAGSGAFELSRRGLEDDASKSEIQQIEYQNKFESMEAHQTAARVLLGTGLVVGAVGAVSLYLDLERADSGPAQVAAGCSLDACQLLARGRW